MDFEMSNPTACQVKMSTAFLARQARAFDGVAIAVHDELVAILAAREADHAPPAHLPWVTESDIDTMLAAL